MVERGTLTVRTHRDNRVNLVVAAGQTGVNFKFGPVSPLQRVWRGGDAVALTLPDARLLHSINAIPPIPLTPFVVTFEDYLPRVPPDRPNSRLSGLLTRQLLGSHCRRILAMSAYAERQFAAQHRAAAYLPELQQKTIRIYPGVPVATRIASEPPDGKRPIRLCAVGYDWLRKGFPAVVHAHEQLRSAGVDVETTLVSQLRWSPKDYIGPPSERVQEEYLQQLRGSSVRHVAVLSRADAQALMAESDVFVFPTLHDTFGYVAIEALAAGTPVITTATCALPEIVEADDNGVLIPMNNDTAVGKWSWVYRNQEPGYEDAYREHIRVATARIVSTVADLAGDSDRLYRMTERALASARERFDMTILKGALEQVYDEALAT